MKLLFRTSKLIPSEWICAVHESGPTGGGFYLRGFCKGTKADLFEIIEKEMLRNENKTAS